MVDKQARVSLVHYLSNKQLSRDFQQALGGLKESIKIDDAPLRSVDESVNQQSMVSVLSIMTLQSIEENLTELVGQMKEMNLLLKDQKSDSSKEKEQDATQQ